MTEDSNVLFEYTDQDAVRDGVLVPAFGPVNRVTRAVFDRFTKPMGESPATGPVVDGTELTKAIEAALAEMPDKDGFRTVEHQGHKLWLVPNEVGGLTLMLPEDY